MSIRIEDIKNFPEHIQKQIKEQIGENTIETAIKNRLAGDINSKQKRCGQKTLDMEKTVKTGMVNIAGPLFVRITRVGKRKLDCDNFSGGAKQLRDAIASMLGRKGDSEEDGFKWEYVQKKGEAETIIEIFKQ